MVLVSPNLSAVTSEEEARPIGYAFALPRLAARLGGRKVRRARLSRWEAYGTGLLVFALSCVYVGRLVLPLVRPIPWQLIVLMAFPFAMWIGWLLFYYLISRLILLLRKLRLCPAVTNQQFQHFVIISLITVLAALLARDETGWMRSLGIFWMILVALNLLSLAILRTLDEA